MGVAKWWGAALWRFAPRSDTARAHMAQTTLTHDTASSEGPTGGGANAPPVADSSVHGSVACLLIHTRAAACIIGRTFVEGMPACRDYNTHLDVRGRASVNVTALL